MKTKSPHSRKSVPGFLASTAILALSGCLAPNAPASLDEEAVQDPMVDADAGVEELAEPLVVSAGADEYPRVGDGYFSSQGRFPVSTTACLNASTYRNTDKATSDGEVKFNIGESQIQTDFNAKASVKATYGLFSGSARAEFMKKSRSDKRSLTYVHRLRTVLGDQLYDNHKPYSFGISPSSPDFYTRCGDHYTYGVKRGGSLYILVQLDFATEEERTAFEAAAKASYTGVAGSGDVSWAKSAFSGRLNVSVFAYQEGGAVDLLGSAFAGTTTKNGMEVMDCALSNFEACKTFIASANNYASNVFTRNLTWANAAALSYNVQPWTQFPETKVSTRDVPSGIVERREWLLAKIQKAADVDNRIQALKRANYFGAPEEFQLDVAAMDAQNKKNVPIIMNAVDICFDGFTGGWSGFDCAAAAYDDAFAEKGYKEISLTKLEPKLKAQYAIGGREVITIKTPVQPANTDWGNWGSWRGWQMCPAGTFAVGYAMQVEPGQGSQDDSGLNGLRLRCDNWDRTAGQTITVWNGAEGSWNPQATCDYGAINGFRIKVEPSSEKDDKGATDLLAQCTSTQELHAAGGLESGAFDDNYEMCPAGTAACGMKVLYEDLRGADFDDTALNNISIACCAY